MSFLDEIFGGVESLVSDTWDNVQSLASDTNQTFDQLYSQDFLGGLVSVTEDVLGNAESLVNDKGYQQAAQAALMYAGGSGSGGGSGSSMGDYFSGDAAWKGSVILDATSASARANTACSPSCLETPLAPCCAEYAPRRSPPMLRALPQSKTPPELAAPPPEPQLTS